MENMKIALIGSADLPSEARQAVAACAGPAPRIDALARPSSAPGTAVRVIPGSFLEAAKIGTAVHGSALAVYAPRSWRAWIPAWFERGLRYTLLAAGWAGTESVWVVPPPAASGFFAIPSELLRRRLIRRARRTLERLPADGLQWRIFERGASEPEGATGVRASEPIRCRRRPTRNTGLVLPRPAARNTPQEEARV